MIFYLIIISIINIMIIIMGSKMISTMLLHRFQQSIKIANPQTMPTMAAMTVIMMFPTLGAVSAYTKKQA